MLSPLVSMGSVCSSFLPCLPCPLLSLKSKSEWLRQDKWVAFYDGSFAPHLGGDTGSIDQLPWRSDEPTSQLSEYLADAKLPTESRVLELGCGTGENLVALSRHAAFVCGVDIVDKAVKASESVLTAAGLDAARVQVVCADVFQLLRSRPPLNDAGAWEFDFIFDCQCFHCLQQVDGSAAADIYYRLLKPGGKILMLTGNSDEPAARGPVQLSRDEVLNAFACTSLVCEKIVAIRFDWTPIYHRQGFADPPLGWASLWRKPHQGL